MCHLDVHLSGSRDEARLSGLGRRLDVLSRRGRVPGSRDGVLCVRALSGNVSLLLALVARLGLGVGDGSGRGGAVSGEVALAVASAGSERGRVRRQVTNKQSGLRRTKTEEFECDTRD